MPSFEIRLVATSPQSREWVASTEYRDDVTAVAHRSEDAWSRDDPNEACVIAEERFLGNRRAQVARVMMTWVSDSQGDEEFFELGIQAEGGKSAYWLRLLGNHETFCSFLIGNNDVLADELTRYPDVSVTPLHCRYPAERGCAPPRRRGLQAHAWAGAGRWA